MSGKPKCIIILSTKSAGSSALQELLCNFGGGRHVQQTRHGEFETLYWTKAASILGLPQIKLPDSEVPIPRDRALQDLQALLTQNTTGFELPADDNRLIFDGWRALCLAHAPVFVEKSPHHLHQWSCLQLMIEAVQTQPEIDFRFVGLVRNPMDALYSAWSRWRLPPEAFQQHWRTAYENLERFRGQIGDQLTVVRYEDFSSTGSTGSRLLNTLEIQATRDGADDYIHGAYRGRWKVDRGFGFQPNDAVVEVAHRFGYPAHDLTNKRSLTWPLRRVVSQATHRLISRPLALATRELRQHLYRTPN